MVTTIYQDEKHKGWEYDTAYRWELTYVANSDCMRYVWVVAMETVKCICWYPFRVT